MLIPSDSQRVDCEKCDFTSIITDIFWFEGVHSYVICETCN